MKRQNKKATKNFGYQRAARQELTAESLSAGDIDLLSERIAEILQNEMKVDRKEALRLRLSVEEVLLLWRDALGEDRPLTLRYGKRLGRPYLQLSLAGESFDPYEEQTQNLLSFYGLAPSYSYINGVNRLTLMPGRRKAGSLQKLLGAFAAAVVVGLLCDFLPETVRMTLAGKILQPLFQTFMAMISAISGPLIFLSVLWGIYAMGDISALGLIGKRLIGRFLAITFASVSIFASAIVWMYDLRFDEVQESSNQFSEIYGMVLDIVPTNIVTPFAEGNSLQIIFLAIVAGLAMLLLRDKTTVMAACVEQLNYMIQLIMDAVSTLVPIFIFASVLNMMLTGVLAGAVSSLKVIVICAVGCAGIVCWYMLCVSVKKKVSFFKLLKKMLPTMLIAITTSSSSAAFGTNMETCEKKLGIDKRIINFGLPMGQVVFMPGAAFMFLAISFMMAQYSQVSVSLSWIVMAVLVSGLLAIAAPPIPGGGLSVYTILFLQLGIPTEAITIALALNTIIEFIATTANLACLQMELTLTADKVGMLDDNTLR